MVGNAEGDTVIAETGAEMVMFTRTVSPKSSSSQIVSLPPPAGVLPLCA